MSQTTNNTNLYEGTYENVFVQSRENVQAYCYDAVAAPAPKASMTDSIIMFTSNNKGLTAAIIAALGCLLGLAIYVGWILFSGASVLDVAKYEPINVKIHQVEINYLDQGFVKADQLGSLLDTVEVTIKQDGSIKKYDRYGDSITIELRDGSLYTYVAPIQDFAGSSGDCGLVTLDMTSGIESGYTYDWSHGSGTSLGELAKAITLKNSSFRIGQKGFYWRDDLSIDSFLTIGRNQVVIYIGYCGYTNSYGPFFTTGLKVTDHLKRKYMGDLHAKRIGISSNGYFVIYPSFFDHYYGVDALDGTDFVFLCGNTLHDDTLGRILTGRGANTITGFTASTGADYCRRMVENYLGLEDDNGLFGTSQDGRALSFWEAVQNAHAKYGKYDESTKEWMRWTGEQPSELKVYPEKGAKCQTVVDKPQSTPSNSQSGSGSSQGSSASDDGKLPSSQQSSGSQQASDPAKKAPASNDGSSKKTEQNEPAKNDDQQKAAQPTGVMAVYQSVLDGCKKSGSETWAYALIDMDSDGTEELLVGTDNGGDYTLKALYTVASGKAKQLDKDGSYGIYLASDHKHLVRTGSNPKAFELKNGSLVEAKVAVPTTPVLIDSQADDTNQGDSIVVKNPGNNATNDAANTAEKATDGASKVEIPEKSNPGSNELTANIEATYPKATDLNWVKFM